MAEWKNLDELDSFKELLKLRDEVVLKEVMAGDNGAKRVKDYAVPMGGGLCFNYASRVCDEKILDALQALSDEAGLIEKYKLLLDGEMINTGEKRLVLHQLTRGQLGKAVEKDGADKREFYKTQQERIAEFAKKVHSGEIANEKARSSLLLYR